MVVLNKVFSSSFLYACLLDLSTNYRENKLQPACYPTILATRIEWANERVFFYLCTFYASDQSYLDLGDRI